MRPAVLALAVSAVVALGCEGARDSASCPGSAVATFRLKGPLVYAGDPRLGALDPVLLDPTLPDCTPDPFDTTAPIRYPHLLPPFDARLAAEPDGTAALCRSNDVVYSGEWTGATHYEVEASAAPAVPCTSACAASLRVFVAGDVALDGGGAPAAFHGILVEVLTELRGACDTCLPLAPRADPPQRACAARYALEGSPR